MPRCGQRTKDAVARVDLGLDVELVAEAAEGVESAERAARGGVEPDEERELRGGDGPAVGAHEVRELVGGGREPRGGEQRGEGVERREAVAEALLAAGPEEERERERRRRGRARGEDLGDERGRHAAELGEVGDDRRAPALVPPERVEEEARERGEAVGDDRRAPALVPPERVEEEARERGEAVGRGGGGRRRRGGNG
nr:unnamed protein product [Digitaria exilis]